MLQNHVVEITKAYIKNGINISIQVYVYTDIYQYLGYYSSVMKEDWVWKYSGLHEVKTGCILVCILKTSK